jgi:hypothetical protein
MGAAGVIQLTLDCTRICAQGQLRKRWLEEYNHAARHFFSESGRVGCGSYWGARRAKKKAVVDHTADSNAIKGYFILLTCN